MTESATFRIGEAGSPEITVTPDLLRGPRVAVDGQPLSPRREGVRLYWPIKLADGTERRMVLTGQMVGLRAIVDGVEYPVERRLELWELVLAVVPIGLGTFVVGAAGLLTGGIATGLSFALFRLDRPIAQRVAGWFALVIGALALGYLGAIALT